MSEIKPEDLHALNVKCYEQRREIDRLKNKLNIAIDALKTASHRFKTDPCLMGNEWLDAAEDIDKALDAISDTTARGE